MKCFLAIFFMLASISFLHSQNSLVADPDSLFLEDQMADLSDPWEQFNMFLKLKNVSADPLEVVWKREIGSDCPLEWEFIVQDVNITYVPWVAMSPEGTQFSVLPQEEVDFGINVVPNTVGGCCTVLAIFSEYNNPDVALDTAYFHVVLNSDCLPSAVGDAISPSLVSRVYPNPFSSKFYIESERELTYEVFPLAGPPVKKGRLSPGNTEGVELDGLPNGAYFIRFLEENTGRVHVVKVFKVGMN
ncbi:MAG: T9SS type A sorting domain-containing protein [Lewinellaceae bacterium]|nr:T9SS type A sorting domain-containing protein [Lewinellaceae bacterium]